MTKESIKRFLKPSKKKAMAFVFVIVVVILSTATMGGAGSGPAIGDSFFSFVLTLGLLPLFVIGFLPLSVAKFLPAENFFSILLFCFFELFYLYLISCLTIVAWKEIKRLYNKDKIGKLLIVALILIVASGIVFSLYRDMLIVQDYPGPCPDAKRQADIRQIGTAMELWYDDQGEYPVVAVAAGGRINLKSIGEYMPLVMTDPGASRFSETKTIGCNDIKGAPYRGFDNSTDRSKFCIYSCLTSGGFFAASHKGIRELDKEPINLDCW